MKTKICSKCHQRKPVSNFHHDKTRRDNLTCHCKFCINQYSRHYRKTEKGKATGKRYAQSKKGKAAQKRYAQSEKGKITTRHFEQSEKNKRTKRKFSLKHNYNITIDDYDKIFKEQKGKCLICGKHQSKLSHRLHVDHDHKTNQIRGLLCFICNTKLGWFEDHQDIISNYLRLQMTQLKPNQ